MIQYLKDKKVFIIGTPHYDYVIHINEYNHLEFLYYGVKLPDYEHILSMKKRYEFEGGNEVSYAKDAKGYMLQHIPKELTTFGKGDFKEPTVTVEFQDETTTLDFVFDSYEILSDYTLKNLPYTDKQETLLIKLKDTVYDFYAYLYISPLTENVIVKNIKYINHTNQPINLTRAHSMQLDLLNKEYHVTKLDGAWIRERHQTTFKLVPGVFKIDSKKGVSSSNHNPFILIKEPQTTYDYGSCYAMGLVYSGDFEINAELTNHNLLHLTMGINSFNFKVALKPNEEFITPEVILNYSNQGINTLINQFHDAINNTLISKYQRHKDRPIVINNWEATYFDFNEKKLLAIAKKAKKLGIETICLDDGWFKGRFDDTSSLGDWQVDPKRFKKGLSPFIKKVEKLGLSFGIWVEPEMISEKSELYRTHPNWAIKLPNREPAIGRNQMVLDLTNDDVITYLKEKLYQLFSAHNISYVKWDMNRNLTDLHTSTTNSNKQSVFNYYYVLGLYKLLNYLKEAFPQILFESCSSGGNRFDLGMLYYMPQTWTSDNTDTYARLAIQEGTSLLYPLSTISNHVSSFVNHQTLRHIPIESRFNVASFGVLGYELDITKMTKFETDIIKKQIAFYKKHRQLFQYGNYSILKESKNSNITIWSVTNMLKDNSIMLYFQEKFEPNPAQREVRISHLKKGKYILKNREQFLTIRTLGSLVNHVLPFNLKVNGFLYNILANKYKQKHNDIYKRFSKTRYDYDLLLNHTFTSTGYNEHTMLLEDYGSRLFIIEGDDDGERKNKN
ncbi:MAG: alpha-galactosidase [Candidatus Izimaplasma sp.]|nr:alpha-galactosidase [Candidatus Izimaplasma bacterium]